MKTLGSKLSNDSKWPKPFIGEAFRAAVDVRAQPAGRPRFSPDRFMADLGHTPPPIGSTPKIGDDIAYRNSQTGS